MRLQQFELLILQSEQIETPVLTIEGEEYVKKGSPEGQFFRAICPEGSSTKSLVGHRVILFLITQSNFFSSAKLNSLTHTE